MVLKMHETKVYERETYYKNLFQMSFYIDLITFGTLLPQASFCTKFGGIYSVMLKVRFQKLRSEGLIFSLLRVYGIKV
jgi:hypothetical protein